MRFHEVRAKFGAEPVPGGGGAYGFSWTINPYRGWSHACVLFCFARPTHTYLGFDAGRDFEKEIVVKVNAPEVLRAETGPAVVESRAGRTRHQDTDPYQWVESRYRLTRDILEALHGVRDSGLGPDQVAVGAFRHREGYIERMARSGRSG